MRKLTLVTAVVMLIVSLTCCKKQPKCGCDKDVLFTLSEATIDYSTIYFNQDGTSASFSVGYDRYTFCNPMEVHPEYLKMKTGDQVIISGNVFWDCTYLMNSSSSYYSMYYKVYNIQVTKMEVNLYGK
jgi:hypothetical protein